MEATLESPGSMADIAAMGWAAGPALSAGRHNAMDARLPDGRMIVMGGHDDPGNNLASTLILEPATNQWTPGPTMTSARGGRGCAAELADGRIIAILSTSGVLIPIGRNIKVLDMFELSEGIKEQKQP